MMLRRAVQAGLVSCGLLLSACLAWADDWAQFRGPNSSGVASSSRSLPEKFSTTDKVLWSAVTGDGVSCPIICQGRTYITAMSGEQKFAVTCFDAATGKEFWKKEFETGKLPKITPPNSHAASTPACDGKRIYVYVATLGMLSLNCADGSEAWRLPVQMPAYLMDWGAAASPIIYQDMVIFNQDDDLNPTLYAVDSSTGKLRWKTDRPDMLAGYSVPLLCTAGGRTDIVVAGTGKLKGYNPADGKEVWTCNTLVRTMMTTPVERDGVIYVSVQSYGDETRTLKFALLEWLDTNQDGQLARAEVPKEFLEKFDKSDKNHDAVLAEAELDNAFQSSDNMVGGGSVIQAIKGGGTGNVTKTHVLWSIKNKSPSNLSSPIVVGNQLFVVKKGGLSSSFDASNGKTQWELKRVTNIGDYFASPVAGDGKIYVPGENGFIVTLEQGPKFKVLGKSDMGNSVIATPAIADGRLYIRTKDKLYCISNEAKPVVDDKAAK